jgi:hypothetical protein
MVLEHSQEHISMFMQLQQSNPALLAMMGEQPLPMPMQPMSMPGSQAQGAPGAAQVMNQGSPTQQKADQIKPPRMPNLPPNADENSKAAYSQMQGVPQ